MVKAVVLSFCCKLRHHYREIPGFEPLPWHHFLLMVKGVTEYLSRAVVASPTKPTWSELPYIIVTSRHNRTEQRGIINITLPSYGHALPWERGDPSKARVCWTYPSCTFLHGLCTWELFQNG